MVDDGYSKGLYTLFSTFICLNTVIIKKEQSRSYRKEMEFIKINVKMANTKNFQEQ